ncbi:MAG: hypothetical protein ACK4FK_02915 [Ferrovibrio sp.]|jgi:hypothetical protein|uniref:hypothetical protein n=1 Tax=Ferrovibrio sp. TaxID=1917215 RepID=UPI00391A343B
MNVSAPTGITEATGGVVLCQDAHALSERRARAMIGRVCRDYLDENILIPIELLHHSGHAKLLNGAENLCAALVQKAAVAQAQATNSPVRDKVKKLYAITTAAITQVETFEKRLPSTPLTHRLLAQLIASDPLYGTRIAYSALAHHLEFSKNWTEKADRCLALFDTGIDQGAIGILDEALAEILQAKSSVPELLGKFRDARLRIIQLMAILDKRYAIDDAAYDTEFAQRLHAVVAKHSMPALRDAVIQLLRRLLISSVPLLSEEPAEEFPATREVYALLTKDRDFALELGAADLFEKRMVRLVTAEKLNKLVPGYYSAPKLMTALKLFEEVIGDGPKEILLKYIAYLYEHRDLEKEFVDPAYTTEEKVEIANELRKLTISTGLSDHRREQFLGILDPLIQRLSKGDQRRSTRNQCGPEDHVVLEGARIPLKNWSAIGLLFGPISGTFLEGELLKLTVKIKNPKLQITFDAEGDVVRYTDEGFVAMKYRCLDTQAAKKVALYFDPLAGAKA